MNTPLNIQHGHLNFQPRIIGKEKACFRLMKLFPQFVFDIAKLEGSPYTFPQVQTLLEGITIGGKRLEDQQLILNQRDSLQQLLRLVKKDKFMITKDIFCQLHELVAYEEALTWGKFRNGSVSIAGTDYSPPESMQLDHIFEEIVNYLQTIQNPLESAMLFFLMGSLAQFFFDGNKRTSRLMMNGILLNSGIDAISIPAKKKLAFNKKMLAFYNTRNANDILKFLCSIAGYRVKKYKNNYMLN
jgi:Fic family protein